MDKETHIKANQLDFAICLLLQYSKPQSVPKPINCCNDSRDKLFREVARKLNKEVADYQLKLINDALKDLQRQYDEL